MFDGFGGLQIHVGRDAGRDLAERRGGDRAAVARDFLRFGVVDDDNADKRRILRGHHSRE